MYLHEDRDLFTEVVIQTAAYLNKTVAVVEKDYYVTIILKLLSKMADNVVFKGGTSLSKGFKVITRFSEDVDITFYEHLGKARRKKLKYNIMKTISEELNMPIANWDFIESDKDYNYYLFQYKPINQYAENILLEGVKVETALASYAFPTEIKSIDNYVRQFLVNENEELIEEYELGMFEMNLQSLERTFIDKVFALCDYYIQGKSKRYSRHIYDICKLREHITFDNTFINLVKEVRNHRASIKICPSAKEGIVVSDIVHDFVEKKFYKQDYVDITSYFLEEIIKYDDAINSLLDIVDKGYFD